MAISCAVFRIVCPTPFFYTTGKVDVEIVIDAEVTENYTRSYPGSVYVVDPGIADNELSSQYSVDFEQINFTWDSTRFTANELILDLLFINVSLRGSSKSGRFIVRH